MRFLVFLFPLILAPAATGAEPPPAARAFEGIWLVVPSPPRMPRRGTTRDAEGRPLGFTADDKGLTPSDYMVRRIMTDAGRAAFDAFDPSEHPANNCSSPGLPSIAMTPYLQEWRAGPDRVEITHEYFSTRRTVHLGDAVREDAHPSAVGVATGRFEGDTLVIRTVGATPAFGGISRNAPSSDARVVTERYRVLVDGDAMEGRITIEDAKGYSNRLIPVVVGDRDRLPNGGIPWIVRRMPWIELREGQGGLPEVKPIADAIRSAA